MNEIDKKYLGYEMMWLPEGEWESCDEVGVWNMLFPFVIDSTINRDRPRQSREERLENVLEARKMSKEIIRKLDEGQVVSLTLAWKWDSDDIEADAAFRRAEN